MSNQTEPLPPLEPTGEDLELLTVGDGESALAREITIAVRVAWINGRIRGRKDMGWEANE